MSEPSRRRIDPAAPFALLAFALAAQLLIQNRRVFEHRFEPEFVHWAWSACILASLLFPRSISLFVATWSGVVWYCAVRMPTPSNHVLLMGAMGVLFVAVVVWRAFAERSVEGIDRERLFRALAPALRISVLVVYFWAFFHKLNTGFFDASESCAITLAERAVSIATGGTWRPELPISAVPLAIGGTLSLEAAIPVLLLIPRTRLLALAIGVPFHAVLGLAGYFSFSTLLFALYLTFLPEGAAERLVAHWRGFCQAHPRRRFAIPVLAIAAALAIFTPRTGAIHRFSVDLWLLAVLCVWVVLLASREWRAGPSRWPDGFLHLHPWPVAILPLALLLSGATPYLGLKTTPALSMFSNLRTEGQLHNHWLVPKAVQIVDWQDDLVSIERGSHPWLATRARPDVRIVFHELRAAIERILRGGREVSVVYHRGGERIELDTVRGTDRLGLPLPWWQRKLVAFRDVRASGCAW